MKPAKLLCAFALVLGSSHVFAKQSGKPNCPNMAGGNLMSAQVDKKVAQILPHSKTSYSQSSKGRKSTK